MRALTGIRGRTQKKVPGPYVGDRAAFATAHAGVALDDRTSPGGEEGRRGEGTAVECTEEL